jgi:hypothetical protein
MLEGSQPRETTGDDPRRLMQTGLRYTIYLCMGGVWLSGCFWLILHVYFATSGDFGVARHPWEPTLLWIHGVLSIGFAYVFGWIMARHASEAWRQHKRRVSGGLLTAVVTVLSVSGFMLFFVSDANWQTQSARVHEVVGLLVTAFMIERWRVLNSRATRGAP